MYTYTVVTHITLYRKYRPQNFKEVRGQDHIVSVLKNALKEERIAHAYLFSGGRGTGKTSIARIFARELEVADTDIYEIDAASNRGIDDIRELRDGVRALPFSSKYKVYIIDEVHMLTKEAFNALLKTLEEPPAHAIFILATTEKDKVPSTIISRCQCFEFKKPSLDVLRDLVEDIAQKEGYSLERGLADYLAVMGRESFRDTLGRLELVMGVATVSKKGKEISLDDVRKALGIPVKKTVIEFFEAYVLKDKVRMAQALTSFDNDDIYPLVIIEDVLELYRLALRACLDIASLNSESALVRYSEEELNSVKKMVQINGAQSGGEHGAKNGGVDACVDARGLQLLIDALLTVRKIPNSYAGLELACMLRIS